MVDLFFDSVVPGILLITFIIAFVVLIVGGLWRRLFAVVVAAGSAYGMWVRWPGHWVRETISFFTQPVIDHPLMSALFALAVVFLITELILKMKEAGSGS